MFKNILPHAITGFTIDPLWKKILCGATVGLIISLFVRTVAQDVSVFDIFPKNYTVHKIVLMIICFVVIWASCAEYHFAHGFFASIMGTIWITSVGWVFGIILFGISYLLIGYTRSETHPYSDGYFPD